MTLKVVTSGGASKTIAEVAVVGAGSISREIAEIRARDSNNVSRTVFSLVPNLSASASPETVYGSTSSGSATSESTTVTPTGGTPPYTYAWILESFDNPIAQPFAVNPTSATTAFTQTSIPPGYSYSASWTCVVTDADGNTAPAPANSFWTSN